MYHPQMYVYVCSISSGDMKCVQLSEAKKVAEKAAEEASKVCIYTLFELCDIS